ncbi:uncharacterized protein LOC121412918 [Lytechinus variegatus]|uniref:uncharacterized protein LOC121412918 n=1 Tax=Lytechinus variegatus TaxID=7654 RepID=UPI001BB244B7|nr:uncharacterized protein LOC121412918 [Lytechinus variegatus]
MERRHYQHALVSRNSFLCHKSVTMVTVFIIISVNLRQTVVGDEVFRLGNDATIKFSYLFTDDYKHSWEIFRVGISDPFNTNGTMKPDALNPSQRERFNVSAMWGTDYLSVHLHIRNITKLDRDVYVWAVKSHGAGGKPSVSTFDVFVDVIVPPGKARCLIRKSVYSSNLREVHCVATVESDRYDGGVQLVCFQNSEKATFQSAPTETATHVKGVFWMNAKYAIRCCSHEGNFVKVPGDCNDFLQDALIEPDVKRSTTRVPLSTTFNFWNVFRRDDKASSDSWTITTSYKD